MKAATSLIVFALSILSVSSANSQTLVQGASAQGTNVSSLSSALSSANGAGNTLIVAVRTATTTQTVAISDSLGNSYTNAVSQTQSTDGHQIFIYYARNIAAGSNTVKATFSASNTQALLAVFEYSGLGTAAPLDKTAHAKVVVRRPVAEPQAQPTRLRNYCLPF